MVCPSCGEANDDRARFCMICGTPLSAVRAAPVREERRVVSVLFADLVGFTASSDRADPEDVRGTLLPFHRMAKEEIERHGGTLDKFIGDAAMGVFGVPVVHEDDAERAVRAALAIQDRVREFGERNPGRAFAVRAGVETGGAVVTLATGPQVGENVVGDVVNTASRLQGVAPVGGVVVGEGAYRLTAGAIDYAALEPVAVKGKAEPLRVWRAVGIGAADTRVGSDGGPFVGRQAELDELARLWEAVTVDRSSRAALVVGEAGIGKSRLVAELRARLAAGGRPAVWRRGKCPPYGEAATFRAFADAIRAHVGAHEVDEPEAVRSKLAAAVDEMESDPADRQWLLARLGPMVAPEGAGGGTDREELFAACERFVRRAASAAPMALVFEDLHFAEPPMAALALHLVHELGGAPALVLCTAREEFLERRPEWSSEPGLTTVRVPSLSDEDMGALVEGLAPRRTVPLDTERALIGRAGGNPLFAREFVRMLAEFPGARGKAPGVPETVQAVVAARLDMLPPDQRALVQTASVVGERFWPAALASVGSADPAAVDPTVASLLARGLIREVESSIEGQRELAFGHAVIRDVAYGQIPRRERAARHAAAGRWIEEATNDRAADRAEALAAHYRTSVELSRAAGEEPGAGVEGAARRFLVLAGARSIDLDAVRATEYYLQALDLMPPDHPERPAVLMRAARVGGRSGRLGGEQTIPMYEEAANALRARGERAAAGEACIRLSMGLAVLGDADRARDALQDGMRLLEDEARAGPELALAYAKLGEDAAFAGHTTDALRWSERALAISQGPDREEATIMALEVRGDSRCTMGDLDGLDDLRRALEICTAAGRAIDGVMAHSWLAEWLWLLEGPERGLAQLDEAMDACERRGLVGLSLWIRSERATMLSDLGRWDEVLTVAGEVRALDRQAGGTQVSALVLAAEVPVLIHRGRAGDGAALVEDMLVEARRAEDLQVLAPALSAAAQVAAAAGDGDEVGRLAEEFQRATTDRSTLYRQVHGPELIRACVAAGHLDLAERLAADPPGLSAREAAASATARAVVALARDRLEDAATGFADCETRWTAYGHRLESALAALGSARALFGLGRSEEAEERLGAAREAFESLGAIDLTAQAETIAGAPQA